LPAPDCFELQAVGFQKRVPESLRRLRFADFAGNHDIIEDAAVVVGSYSLMQVLSFLRL
jgi:hypothetical protein